MIINIKRKQDGTKLKELKYEVILKNDPKLLIGYDWNLKGEYTDESLEDFHLFCLSIVVSLFEKKFQVNEDRDEHSYNFDEDEFDIESTLEDLSYLYSFILAKKLKGL